MAQFGPFRRTQRELCLCQESPSSQSRILYKAITRTELSQPEIRTQQQRAAKTAQQLAFITTVRRCRGGGGREDSGGLGWTWARMLTWCQVLFQCRSITRAITECVALWKTSRRLRWKSLIVFETWTLTRSLLVSTPMAHSYSLKMIIGRDWRREGFQGQPARRDQWEASRTGSLWFFFTISGTSNSHTGLGDTMFAPVISSQARETKDWEATIN